MRVQFTKAIIIGDIKKGDLVIIREYAYIWLGIVAEIATDGVSIELDAESEKNILMNLKDRIEYISQRVAELAGQPETRTLQVFTVTLNKGSQSCLN
jgi:hypothetical protein